MRAALRGAAALLAGAVGVACPAAQEGGPPSEIGASHGNPDRAAAARDDEPEVHSGPARRLPPPTPEEIAELPADGGDEFNRLVFEGSPYLLQHCRNPVDWWPWSEAAFEEARRRDVPVFLSVGYSTCHWCHVMEHESFEDPEVAALMNAAFVCVKVDREERPDVDEAFMRYTRALTRGGGWPMTVLMTPDKQPFYAGTYFPRSARGGRAGMLELVPHFRDAWASQRDEILEHAESGAAYLSDTAGGSPSGDALGLPTLLLAFEQLGESYEPAFGGFTSPPSFAPKFPIPHNLRALLRWHARTGDEFALEMVTHTLDRMRLGGLFDHVGYGFHRYSVDVAWFLPHFEKMLYDQALLAIAYCEAYQVTGDESYARTAREIFTYVLRDMTSPEGGFYSAEDADSEGEEGLFYLWRPEEVVAVLGEEDGALWNEVFGVEEGGNFVEEGSGERTGESHFFLARTLATMAEERDLTEGELRARLEPLRAKLFEAREPRVHPLKDDKVLTDWNGLMIAALAVGARVLDEPAYGDAATAAAEFVERELRDDEGRLYKRWRAGDARFDAMLEDHAYLAWGYLELYQSTFDVRWLERSVELCDEMLARFHDAEHGGFYLTPEGGEELFARAKAIYDGARPSGNSVAADVFLRVGRITARGELEDEGMRALTAFHGEVTARPSAYCHAMLALDFAVGPAREIVVAGEPGAEDTEAMLRALRSAYLPNAVVVFRPAGVEDPAIGRLADYALVQDAPDGVATAYVCQNYACQEPTNDVATMLANLGVGAEGEGE